MSLAEDLCLLGIDPDSGRARFVRWQRDLVLGAALFAELEDRGVIAIEGAGPAADVRLTGRLFHDPDPVVAAAVERAAVCRWNVGTLTVIRLGEGAWRRQVQHLLDTGVLRLTRTWPTPRYAVLRPDLRDAVVRRVRAVLVGGAEPDLRTRRLVALVHASRRLGLVLTPQEVPEALDVVYAFDRDVVLDAFADAWRVTNARRITTGGGTGC